jgi:hypothetical protein
MRDPISSICTRSASSARAWEHLEDPGSLWQWRPPMVRRGRLRCRRCPRHGDEGRHLPAAPPQPTDRERWAEPLGTLVARSRWLSCRAGKSRRFGRPNLHRRRRAAPRHLLVIDPAGYARIDQRRKRCELSERRDGPRGDLQPYLKSVDLKSVDLPQTGRHETLPAPYASTRKLTAQMQVVLRSHQEHRCSQTIPRPQRANLT